ncbi:ABC transporter ATP-binding protein [Clostridium botulinum]|uniref:ABC transporter ATP-binding protein n=1 Tax=Clostridium botulinum TaxID=1491 RepID=UPI000774E529|nr:ABC transporter ATP-binding protein [Clostridium botulinum]NFE96240.1 ABC transporter ATP-binding protein [Clostridium botulinum]NFI54504.1 ABC transporter ATP-binding protein [Clostridium botulinum]NFL39767.1 ABC transporter ATP-binding protein [Clostridium botulinum]NFL66662.1 ABC transporter ATP-binding protein [Clostridium botulinum]NFN09638.1 ABC transporter ATP-binding protein [Clostridium botulinum]
MSLIELKNLSKNYTFGDTITYALKDVNLCVEKQEMIAIMGPSGAGKSTLLNIIGCLDNYTNGTYLLNGKSINKLSKKDLAIIRNKNIGFIFQHFALIPEYTVFENLELPLLYRNNFTQSGKKMNKNTRIDLIKNSLNSVSIGELIYKKPSYLSGGQQQRVAIARALIAEPDIILADEPTGALDQKTGHEIMTLLKSINNNGKTIIIVTHDPNVASYCDRVIKVVDGHLFESN